jgi:hypothetical protein
MSNKLLIICLSLFSLTIASNMNSDNVVVAINCGGEKFKDSDGIEYEKVKQQII